jgi:D-alanyl-D-alanine carboxypeptidase (penicillin-binding protein 5/6)
LKEMLIAIAVGSANDCSVAVAEHIAGSETAFAKMMTERAKETGSPKYQLCKLPWAP